MNIIFEESIEHATNEDIEAFEATFHFTLPQAYRQFLLQYNGGMPGENIFDYQDEYALTSSTVRLFLTLGLGPDSLGHYLEIYASRIPQNALPIAYDDGGNLICLIFESQGTSVVFWNHEQEGEEFEKTVFFFVSENFEAFCQGLHSNEQVR